MGKQNVTRNGGGILFIWFYKSHHLASPRPSQSADAKQEITFDVVEVGDWQVYRDRQIILVNGSSVRYNTTVTKYFKSRWKKVSCNVNGGFALGTWLEIYLIDVCPIFV